jgi:hypothetical protein
MNKTIKTLLKQKKELEAKLNTLEFEIRNTDRCLQEEIYKETQLYDKVLKNNLIDIIQMIHKRGLKCSSVSNAETEFLNTVYKVSDGTYYRNICAQNGTIVANSDGIDNDGGGASLYKKVDTLIEFNLITYCEENKLKYEN